MKKILVMFAILMAMFMTTYASPPTVGCDIEKSQVLSETDGVTSTSLSEASMKVIISHKDTLICSWSEGQHKRMIVKAVEVPRVVYTSNSLGYVLNGEGGV